MALKLGKQPASHDPRDLTYDTYRDPQTMVTVPATFGHYGLVQEWGMLGNDKYGDCVWAGGDHETIMWNAEAGKTVSFRDQDALADYAACTGFDPKKRSTDKGTDVHAALNYRRKTGLRDAGGTRHMIGAYIALEPGNYDHVLEAIYLFGAVGIGLQFPSSAMAQFDKGKPWSVVGGASIEGGHYVPLVGIAHGRLDCVTWGKVQPMTKTFFAKYCDEAYALVSVEALAGGKSPEGFDLQQLTNDLAAL
jgi:hypothetical protein